MAYVIGIDLGTSSAKALITTIDGKKAVACSRGYDIITPQSGYAEEDPAIWWDATAGCIADALKKSGIKPREILSVGISGQMHGLVMLDRDNQPLGNAILHCDVRSSEEIDEITDTIGGERLKNILYNPVFPGFQLPSLLWIRNHRPRVYEQIKTILSPKDYIRYKLTNELGTEITDASATLLCDVQTREWSREILTGLPIDPAILLPISQSYEIAGKVTKAAADACGLSEGTPVVYGVADQPAQALGNGLVEKGKATSNIGTSGQIFTPVDTPILNPLLNTHTFCHAPADSWYVMGAMLSAGLSVDWLNANILNHATYHDMDAQAHEVGVSAENPVFQPYLCGERTPHMNPKARGMFFGLSLQHHQGHMIRAVMEGVVFALKDSLLLIEGLGTRIDAVIASGGGASSELWLQMQADIFEREIVTTASAEQANLGAAILAATGIGVYGGIREACGVMVKPGGHRACPNQENVKVYRHLYDKYQRLYESVHDLY